MADTLTDIKTSMATMGTKLDLLIQRIDPVMTDHEQRLRKVEAAAAETRTKLRTWLAIVGVAATGGGTGLGTLLAHFTGA